MLKVGVVTDPEPSTKTVRSIPKPGGGGPFATVTTLGLAVPLNVEPAVACAEMKCGPSGVSLVSHENVYGGLLRSGPSAFPSRRN